MRTRGGKPIGKYLGFTTTAEPFANKLNKFSTCRCDSHAAFLDVDWPDTGFYSRRLAEVIVSAAEHTLLAD